MSSESRNTEPGVTEAGATQSKGSGRSGRRLGRGLEDVSQAFLSRPAGEAVQPAVSEPLAPTQSQPDNTAGEAVQPAISEPIHADPGEPDCPVVLKPCPSLKREQLVSLLKREAAALEDGLKTIDVDIPCDGCGAVDLFAVDPASRLTIIDLDVSPSEMLLLRGIAHYDWAIRNVASLERMYRGHVINFSQTPRLFLIAPQFSFLFRCAARQITSPQIRWFRYHPVAVAGGAAVLFEGMPGLRSAYEF
jgi:hypothetical protein